jgi:DNA-binding transcriptional ArsR family regulator
MDISTPAALMGDPTRAAFLTALADGTALPASELAQRAGVGASTASIQLAKLVDGGLLEVERTGRHRYYRPAWDPSFKRREPATTTSRAPSASRCWRACTGSGC